MESFKWGPQFITGLRRVDDQHQNLVAMINKLGESIAENAVTRDDIFVTLQSLADYAQQHFNTEEKLMTENKVDVRHIRHHLKQHANFVKDVGRIAETIDFNDQKDSQSLLKYLINWLVFHILGTDQNLASQVREIESGLSPQQAYTNFEQKADRTTQPLVAALTELFALVSDRNEALEKLNQTLEHRVAERTKELVNANKRLEKISVTDHLTNLPNRRFAMVQLKLLLEETRENDGSLACLMIDADDFKEVNDMHGHDAGDVVLKRLAEELHHSVRSDDIVCRLGGDEFIVICPNTDMEGARILGEHTRKNVAALKVPAGDGFWYGSVSIGVACTSNKTKDVKELLKDADDAVYEAKRCGRNCVR